MNNQEAFNNAYIGVLRQNKIAFANGNCAYIDNDGCKCGIGQSIPKRLYRKAYESNSITTLLAHKRLNSGKLMPKVGQERLKKLFADCDLRFLGDLQSAHDSCASLGSRWRSQFIDNMKALARQWNLTVPEGPIWRDEFTSNMMDLAQRLKLTMPEEPIA